MTRKALIGLVMIVKDEAHGIAKTLASLVGAFDHWTILDTGSSDGTQGIVREALHDYPGSLYEEPFIDFAASRNRALELHGTTTTFTLMPDSDDYLVGPTDALRTFCEERKVARTPHDDAYLIEIRRGSMSWGSLSYHLPLLLRSTARWRYRGRVHECVGGPKGALPATVRVPRVALHQDAAERSAEASQARWLRDLDLLREDLARDPKNARAAFYLAQTLECLGRREEALEAYEHRIQMGDWADEAFEAALRRAGMMAALGAPWPKVKAAYLSARALSPERAEPLYRIAEHYYGEQRHAESYLFARAAAALPRPATTLFVDADVYEWKAADTAAISAFYVAQETGDESVREEGHRLARRAVRARPLDGRLRHNLSFYARSAREIFKSFSERPIRLDIEAPYAPLNPSIYFDGQSWRCLVRTVNYRIGDGRYYGPGGDEIRTRNFLLEMTADLETTSVTEMIDRDPTPRSAFPVHGFEDCRLFSLAGRLFATCTVCDFTEHGAREIALLSIDEDCGVSRAKPLRGPWSRYHQKNWMPFVDGENLRVIYSTYPEVILSISNPEDDATTTVDSAQAEASMTPGNLRGGSQAIATPEGWLFVIHTVDASGEDRTYLHRFVLMSRALRVIAMSRPFHFRKRGVEFCAGLAVDGDRVVASFGVDDREAWLGVFRLSEILTGLESNFEL